VASEVAFVPNLAKSRLLPLLAPNMQFVPLVEVVVQKLNISRRRATQRCSQVLGGSREVAV
jgi:hypothetical protein